MKRIVFLSLIIGLISSVAFADCTESQYYLSSDASVLVIKVACVGSAVDGSVADLDIDASAVSSGLKKTYQYMGFYLWDIWTVAGTVTPPDAADITITDALNAELHTKVGAIQATGTTDGGVTKPVKAVTSTLTYAVANQATASATWDTYIQLVK